MWYYLSSNFVFFIKVVLYILSALYFYVNLELACQFLKQSLLGIWLGWHQIYMPICRELTSYQYRVFWSINMVCYFIYFGLVWFLLALCFSFQCIDLIHLLLDLSLIISYFNALVLFSNIRISPPKSSFLL